MPRHRSPRYRLTRRLLALAALLALPACAEAPSPNYQAPPVTVAAQPAPERNYIRVRGRAMAIEEAVVKGLRDEAAWHALDDQIVVRRTKAEVAPELPPKLYGGEHLDSGDDSSPVAVWLDMDGKQRKAYDSMVKDAVAQVHNGTIMPNATFSINMRLRQLANAYARVDEERIYPALPSNKFDWLTNFLDEHGIDKTICTSSTKRAGKRAEVPKIIVASQFTKLLELFAIELGRKHMIQSWLFTGNTKARDRQHIEHDWQDNPNSGVRVLFLNMVSGGTSLTLDAADDVVMLDKPWNQSDATQVEDRVHRISRIHQVTIWNLLSRDTLEEGIARNTTAKDRDIKAIMDGSRGVEFMMKILGQR